MLFTLEALKAAYGDALLLHFGDASAPQLVAIDGGPSGTYNNVLRPRLDALKRNPKRVSDGQLPIRLLMVSHIDDDHVNGVLELAKEMNTIADDRQQLPYRVESLWHNSFDDILGNEGQELAASLEPLVKPVLEGKDLPAAAPVQHHTALVMASVAQGRELRDAANRLGWDINKEFGGKLVQLPESGPKKVSIGKGISLTVLGPQQARVKALNAEWDKYIKKKQLDQPVDTAKAAEYADNSVFNLSSIIVLVEATGADGKTRRMLLTGDARGDHILEGLKASPLGEELKQNGRIHLDLIKLPHHGSDRNMEQSFFEQVTADHYVVSSNGDKFDNPDQGTLDMLVNGRKKADPAGTYTVHLTYPVEEFKFKKREHIQQEMQAFVDAGAANNYTVLCRAAKDPSVKIHLGDEPLAD